MIVLLPVVGIVLLGVVAFALYETSAARRDRDSLLALKPEAASQAAASNVVRARSQFTLAVEAYERGMANAQSASRVVETSGGSLFAGDDSLRAGDELVLDPNPELDRLELAKEEARNELLAAQREWEQVRPLSDADASAELWSGHGVLRGWQLGPIGYERAFIRLEHVLDSTCWGCWETRRFRWGLAIGAERQQLAMFAAAVPIDKVEQILSQGMGGAEFAVRPGFSPQRWWRRRRRLPAPRRATSTLLQTFDLAEGPDEPTRSSVRKAFEVEMGQAPETVGSLGEMDGVLSVLASGPSLLVGGWWGTEPKPVLLAGSAHTGWRESN